jgi:hypothetical protein
MLPRQESYSGSTKNSITSNSFGSYIGSYKFVSSPNKKLNSDIGDTTPLIDNGPRNKDHGKVIITFLSKTLPKQQVTNFNEMRQKIIIDMEIYYAKEKIKNKQEINNNKDLSRDVQDSIARLEQERNTLNEAERRRQADLVTWQYNVDIQERLQAQIQADKDARKVLEKEIMRMRETSMLEKGTGTIPKLTPCSNYDSRYDETPTECWLNVKLRDVGRIPNKYPCSRWDPRYYDDGVSCWLNPVGRGWGKSPNKRPCSDWNPAYIQGPTECYAANTYGVGGGRGADLHGCPDGSNANAVGDCWSEPDIYTKKC